MSVWRGLSLDARVVGALALGDLVLLLASATVVQVTRDGPLWLLFPGLWGPAWLLACAALAAAYPLRDHRHGPRFATRDRVLHLAAIVTCFVIVPAIAMIVLRETGKPYTYVHDGAIMVEEAARKLLAGQDPYVADYLDTPLFYWPMINNPALYHFTYFPLFFIASAPFVWAFDHLGLFFDARYLYLPAYVATLVLLPWLLPAGVGDVEGVPRSRDEEWRGPTGSSGATAEDPGGEANPGARRGTPEATSPTAAAMGLSLVAIVALDPQLFAFVAEGRNDFLVLLPLFAGIALLQRRRHTLGLLALAIAGALKLHASLLLPFAVAYVWWSDERGTVRERFARVARASLPGAAVLAATFLPFLIHDLGAFWDDVVSYNAGGAAWSYPISGLGFSAVLLASGVLSYPQEAFPFWVLEALASVPIALWSLRRLQRDPGVATLLEGYAITLLAFAYFGRYFNGNHLGFILAVAAPIPFLRRDLAERVVASVAGRLRGLTPAPRAVTVPVEGDGDRAA